MAIDLSTATSRTSTSVMSIATPLKDSMTFMTTKGLTNRPGQNNCFLNSSIQVLWHLDVFRRSFRDLTGHACLAESCIFCALKELFSELQHSPAKALPPDSLRKALADSFLDQQRFQIGFMDDAAECFENMLLRIHDHVAHREPEDACTAPHCVPHQKFAMTLVEQSICQNCRATTEPMSFTQMVQYVSTSTLVHQLRLSVGQTGRPDQFGRLLQKAGNMGDTRPCPVSCGSTTQMCRVLMNHPEIVSIGLVWNSEKPSLEHIMDVFSCIDTTLRLNQVFNSVTDSRWAETTTHNLVGVVTYYGKHYSTFFFNTKLMEWIFLDDATVRDVGPRWEQVVEKCRKGKFQPLLLLYATPNGTPINLDYAPKLNTPFYADKAKPQEPIANQQLLRRSVTPSPEKPIIGNTRRAITPNPENSALNQKPPLPKHYNEYQNLSVIQKNISIPKQSPDGCDQVDGQKSPEYITKRFSEVGKPHVNIHRTLSNGSSSGVESAVCIPDHLNVPRRRDSGNWSGDRNSASSASSTTMENPYLYLVGKMPPGSPTRIKGDPLCGGGNGAVYDAGYDSYSLSSNDSTNMTTLQHMMKTGHLAQIPEDYSNVTLNQNSQSCDVLCDEADELLVKSRQLEDGHDLVLALALCNAAATKARAAMNAPYNNPQTLTLARMKHNTCIMRARSLHRRMTQTQNQNKDNSPEIRHTREGSSGSGRHSRQNSRDKGHHSRQSSRELLLQQEKDKAKPTKSIEIYATLPKKRDALKAKMNAINIEDEEYMLYSNKTPERESRSIFSKSKNKEAKVKEKRSRSEDRNKISRADFSIAPEIITGKDTLKKAKESKEDKKDKEGKNKKQHKIRRKLLMGGLIRRKNRSMPDLTDSNADEPSRSDRSNDVLDGNANPEAVGPVMSGYLSEGHLEFTGATANPNLERSKLMRKSFHGSAGKILTAAKVPPPPPLRTTSQLSRTKPSESGEVGEKAAGEMCQFNIYGDVNIYHNLAPFNQSHEEQQSSMSLPYYAGNSNSSYDDDSFVSPSSQTVVTQADVHFERNPNVDSGLDEVDCLPSRSAPILELPPYPSPGGSAIHSRQASEEFPPPPPPLDLSALDEYLPRTQSVSPEPNSLLARLQSKRHQILAHQQDNDVNVSRQSPLAARSTGDKWLKELQAKQAALRMKKSDVTNSSEKGLDEVNTQRYLPDEVISVKSLASKFENTQPNTEKASLELNKPTVHVPPTKSEFAPTIAPEQIAEEIREVEMITSAVNKVFGNHHQEEAPEGNHRAKPQKKKSVSFCDQVTLVATAEEQEEDTYIPNPILERVLRSAVNNPETMAVKQELKSLRDQSIPNQSLVNSQSHVNLQSRVNIQSPVNLQSSVTPQSFVNPQSSFNSQSLVNPQSPNYPVNLQSPTGPINQPVAMDPYRMGDSIVASSPLTLKKDAEQPVYVRRNSLENLLNQDSPRCPPSANNMYNGGVSVQQNHPAILHSYQQYPVHHQQNLNEQYYGGSEPAPSNNQYSTIYDSNQHPYYVPGFSDQYNISSMYSNNNNLHYTGQGDVHRQGTYGGSYQIPPYGHQTIPISDGAQHIIYKTADLGTEQGISSRQSPYQPIPQNSAVYPGHYGNSRQIPVRHCQGQNIYGWPNNQPSIRQSTPSPSSYPNAPPSAPCTNSCANFHPNLYGGSPGAVYQRIPPPNEFPQNYEQRVPRLHGEEQMYPQVGKYPVYQQVPSPKHMLKKSVSFEPGTKGCESPIPKPVVTPIVVNNANNCVPTDKTKCSLCRKKHVVALNLYCKDCEFYMSRFKPKT